MCSSDLIGCDVVMAENGREAVAHFKNAAFDIVLMDCQMPIMDGFEATAAIRSMEETANAQRRTPIIAVTASVLEEDRQHCLEAGMDDFCMKPIVARNLRQVLERWHPSRLSASTSKQ